MDQMALKNIRVKWIKISKSFKDFNLIVQGPDMQREELKNY